MISDVLKINRQALIDFRGKYFSQKKLVVVAAGDLAGVDSKMIAEHFDRPEKMVEENEKMMIELTNEVKKEVARKGDQSHFGIAVPTFGSLDKRRYALRLLETMLSGNASSKLFEEIRSKRGLAYYVSSIGEELREVGFWGVQIGVANENLERTIELTVKYLTESDFLTEANLSKSKNYIEGKTMLAMDRSDYWASMVAEDLLLKDKVFDPMAEVAKLKKVTEAEVRQVQADFFIKERVKVFKIKGK